MARSRFSSPCRGSADAQRARAGVLALAALLAALASPARAADGIWTNSLTGTNSWGDATRWTNGIVGNGQDAAVTFSGPSAQGVTNNLNATFGTLLFNAGNTRSYTVFGGTLTGWVSSGAVQINTGSADDPIILSELYLKNNVSNYVVLNHGMTVSNLNGGGAALTWTKWGTGALTVRGDNRATWKGNWDVSQGTLAANANSGWALGSGSVTLASGTYLSAFAPGGSGITLTNTSSIITGQGTVKYQAGTFVLLASNDYSGGTLVMGNNRVVVGNDSALGTGTITFNDPNARMSANGGATRTLANDVVITNLASMGNTTDNGLLVFNGSVNLAGGSRSINLSSAVTFNGVVTNGGIYKQGVGTLTLANPANTYSLGTTNLAGVLALGADNPLGSGPLVMNGGILTAADATARTLTNQVVFAANPSFGQPGTGNLTLTLPTIDLGGARVITVSNAVTTFSGTTTNGSVAVAGGGRLVLNEAWLTGLRLANNSSALEIRGGTSTVANALTNGAASWNTLLLTNGARVVSDGATGYSMVGLGTTGNAVRITGPGSSWLITNSTIAGAGLRVGSSAIGATSNRVEVLDGATLQVDNNFQISSAFSNSSWNSVLVSGPGSQLIAQLKGGDTYLRVAYSAASLNSAYSGTNSLVVTNGGLVDTRGLAVGNLSNAGNVVSVSGAVLQFSTNSPDIQLYPNSGNAIYVSSSTIAFRDVTNVNVKGNWGVGALGKGLTNFTWSGENTFRLNNASLTNGGQDYVFDTGRGSTNYAALEMVNGTTLWQGGSLTIGAGGAMLVSNTAATVASAFTNLGAVRVVNATLAFSQQFTVGGNGSLALRNATNTLAGGLVVASNSTLGGSGRIASDVAVTNFGTISPGNSPGTLTFSSNLALLDSSLLVLEIGGTNSADYDHLVVEGTLAKAGAVLVTNLGWTFVGGETFDFVDAAALAGSFSALSLPTLTGGMTWNTSLFESQGILSVVAIPEPSALLALAGGALLLAFRRKRATR
jgi:autotransporter-associated beta strand protein